MKAEAKTNVGFVAAALLCVWSTSTSIAQSSAANELDRYNVVWTTPSKDASGAMPIGNGEVGLNLWVEDSGDLLFYIARTDSWSECSRLLKIGRIRLSFSPGLFSNDQPFRQELRLRDGQIVITAGDAALQVFVDAKAPIVYVTGKSKTPRTISAKLECWRKQKHILKGDELQSSWTMKDAPDSIDVWESADLVSDSARNAVIWRHRNEYSVVPLTLKHQGLGSLAELVRDPLLNRTFGGLMAGAGFVQDGVGGLKSARPATNVELTIAVHTAQTASPADWQRETVGIARDLCAAVAAKRTAAWWNDFWERSWIFVDGAPRLSRVTEACILQRWITACGGRGNYPIKFNGSIFTVEPKLSGGPDFSADWRKWGDCYWWQNTRLPYFAMIASGDFDQVRTLWRFYHNALPLCKARAKLYHNVEGAYFPEVMTIFGTYANGNYGWNRQGHQPNEVLNQWWRYAWQQGLELTALMLDYYEHTEDERFPEEELLPISHEVLRYYDTRFGRDGDGKLIISPTQAVETYWYDVVNDTPSVAGLQEVLGRLLMIQSDKIPAAEREFWKKMQAAAPPLPLGKDNGTARVRPAEKFKPKRNNCENPELYAIWPFRLFGVGRPDLDIGIETFHRRLEKASFGWQYDGQCAAILGLTDEAQKILLGKLSKSNPKHRFPAMWGPNYDWLPDQDHGSNILLTIQHMLLDSAGEKIILLPAWPKEWNVAFKLHAPRRTTVECDYRGGKIEKLAVFPAQRMKDVQYPPWLSGNSP